MYGPEQRFHDVIPQTVPVVLLPSSSESDPHHGKKRRKLKKKCKGRSYANFTGPFCDLILLLLYNSLL